MLSGYRTAGAVAASLAIIAVLLLGARVGSWYGTSAAIAAVLAVAALLARGLRRSDPGFNFFCAVFIFGGLGAVFYDPVTNHAIIQAGLAPKVTYLLTCVLADIATFSVLSMFSTTLDDPRAGRRRTIRRAAVLLACTGVMTALVTGLHTQTNVPIFPAYSGELHVAWIQTTYSFYLTLGASEFLFICVRYLRRDRPPRRVAISIWLEVTGAIVALVFSVWQIARAWADLNGGNTVLDNNTISELVSAACFGSMVIGATWLMWAPAVLDRLSLGWAWISVRAMTPLHQVLPRELLLHYDHDDLCMVRTWIAGQIQDVRGSMVDYIHPGIAARARDTARGKSRSKDDTLVRAAELASALDAFEEACRADTPAERAKRVRRLVTRYAPYPAEKPTIITKITPAGLETYDESWDFPAEPVSLKEQIAQDLPFIRLAKAFGRRELIELRAWARENPALANASTAA
ncbi:hypothetical protein [Amycolatopsis sp. GM8]|uniref:hypothetical protein n=1 Tax=Amycolatopsis sp. GM8 TaxID=2896530 RepID=UPI001F4196DD|nr:hypothetical protein [Amycolatopsis sp. GM8]